MYLGYQNNKIKFYTENELPKEFYNIDKSIYTEEEYVLDGEEYVLNDDDYKHRQAEKRRVVFLKDFFKVEGYGYYRRIPKGYQSAVESMNVLFNVANITKGVQEGLIIFYQEPDFTDAEQCTEEWLIQHQIIMSAMTLNEFMQLYVAFMTAWNTEEHNESTTDNE